ncbi:DUF421 domain-containing protein [Fictibacillus aquaticus]|uniref:YetF C-terminal domain-containing protein n=1 Tax=Fictibacillus aquaticus TaxID=2021314 RepID=A0A235F5W9_9BACL|nr:DUF421 domain-containing protein [Fictibacillus aquaticus]OYD56696.1 hypothetical protein CGZ90_16950 [Fictibacillus aquaticus]
MPDVFGNIEHISLLGYLIRTVIVGAIGFFVGRLVSKRAVNQMTTYDFALIWILGAITVSPLLDGKISFTYMLIPLFTLFLWHTIFSLISLKSRKFSFFFNGKPAILIDNGKVVLKNLKRQFFSLDLLLSELRVNNIFDVSQVKYAILEPNGHISIMKVEKENPVTPADMKLTASSTDIPLVIINEGKVIHENLAKAGVDEQWLMNNLAVQGVVDFKDVFLSTINRNKKLFVLKNG